MLEITVESNEVFANVKDGHEQLYSNCQVHGAASAALEFMMASMMLAVLEVRLNELLAFDAFESEAAFLCDDEHRCFF